MKQILIIYTGGTIGMVPGPNGLHPSSQLEEELHTALTLKNEHIDFDFVQLSSLIDSSNLKPSHWQNIAEAVLSQLNNYHAFIVLHGTDTMAYSSAALSYIFAGLKKTIVFTGSQIPLALPNSDALDNVIGALTVCRQNPDGVHLYFGGQLLAANRVSKISSRDFKAFACANMATGDSNGLPPYQAAELDFIENAVAVVHFYPGISPQSLRAQLDQPELKAAILLSYGAGNVPADDQTLMAELKTASDRGVVMVNISQCPHGGVSQGLYQAGDILNQCGVLAGGDMNLEGAFAKAHYLIAQGLEGKPLKQQMVTNLAGELSP